MEKDKKLRDRIRKNASKIRRGQRGSVNAVKAGAEFNRLLSATRKGSALDSLKAGNAIKGFKVITNMECVDRCLAARSNRSAFETPCTQLCAEVGSCNGCRGFRSVCQHVSRLGAPTATELCTQTYVDVGCPGR